jgi:hypothetical protein
MYILKTFRNVNLKSKYIFFLPLNYTFLYKHIIVYYIFYNNHVLNSIDSLKYIKHGIIIITAIIIGNNLVQQNDIN